MKSKTYYQSLVVRHNLSLRKYLHHLVGSVDIQYPDNIPAHCSLSFFCSSWLIIFLYNTNFLSDMSLHSAFDLKSRVALSVSVSSKKSCWMFVKLVVQKFLIHFI